MVLLIDTNIILDVLLSRSDFVKESSIIWKLCETEQAKGYISTLTYANMMYIMRKQMTPEQIEDVFRKLKLIFEFADFSSVVLEMADIAHHLTQPKHSPHDQQPRAQQETTWNANHMPKRDYLENSHLLYL